MPIPHLFLFILTSIICLSAHAATPLFFEGTCSGVQFCVTAVHHSHPLYNTFYLSAITPSRQVNLFKSGEGGWFHAACILAKDGKQILVFQSYCGGNGCLEGKYGAIEPSSLKLLLQPSPKNVENHKQISALLGFSVPHLDHYKGSFCCNK